MTCLILFKIHEYTRHKIVSFGILLPMKFNFKFHILVNFWNFYIGYKIQCKKKGYRKLKNEKENKRITWEIITHNFLDKEKYPQGTSNRKDILKDNSRYNLTNISWDNSYNILKKYSQYQIFDTMFLNLLNIFFKVNY